MGVPNVTHDDRAAGEMVPLVGVVLPQLARDSYSAMSITIISFSKTDREEKATHPSEREGASGGPP